MKKFYLFIVALIITTTSFAQLTGTKTIPGDYPTIAAAIIDLNSLGVGAGGVTFNITAGYLETISAPLSITATGTLANPIIFQRIGAGANPKVTAYVGTSTPGSAIQDGIWNFIGSDYVTIDGIDLLDPNSTNPATMEYGFGMFKATAINGCQYNTIKNCVVTLSRVNNASGTSPAVDGSRAINVMNALVTTQTTVAVPLSAGGTNSYNKFYSNTLQNCNIGIALIGYAGASPFTLCDFGNDIGGTSLSTGNNILNYGGAPGAANPAAGVRTLAQYTLNVSYNTVNNNNGSGVSHVSTLRGIYLNTALSASATISYNTLTINSGSTTSQVSVIENVAGSTAAANTININNNTISSCTWATATSGTFYTIYNTATPFTLNIYGNIISSISLPTTGAFYGIMAGSPTNLNIYNNEVGTITKSLSGNIYAMYAGTSIISVHDNNIHDLTIAGGGNAMYGFYDLSSPVNESYYNNTFNNFTNIGTGGVFGIYTNTAAGTRNVYSNTIYNFSAAGGGPIYGIYGAASSPNIYKNRLYNLSSGTTAGSIWAIYNSSGTTANIYNNYISDLRTPAATGIDAIRGIYILGGTTANVYFNTVYLNASSTSVTTFGTTGIYKSSTTTGDFRNNIIVNVSTPGPTGGFTVAYRWSGTYNVTYYAATSNNNDFYAGIPAANKLIFYDGLNADQTLAAYKTLVSPRDANSITENPTFVNVGATPYDLHINAAVSTQVESGGTTVSAPIAIVDDYDAQARYPNAGYPNNPSYPATAPDIGADEFAGIPLDVTPPTIVYSPLANTASLLARTLTATITDVSGVPTSGIGLPVLYWKKTGDPGYTAVTGVSIGGNQYTFTFGAGVALANTVSYYIVAQDMVTPTPNVGAYPSAGASGFTPDPPNCSTPPTTPSSYLILGTICGSFNVGVAQTYTTLTAAVADLNSKEISCAVTFVLTDATYPSETFPIIINANTGSSAVNTVTIKPATTAAISGSSASALIKFNGASYMIIDGSNSGGADRSLTLSNTVASGTTTVVWVGSIATGNGSNYITIKNCNISNGYNSLSSYGIFAGSSASIGTAGDDNDNLTIQNNSLSKAYFGIWAQGSATGLLDNLQILQNSVGSPTPANYIGHDGIIVGYTTGSLISQNTVFNITPASTTPTGITISTGCQSSVVTRNNLNNIISTSTGGYGGRGFYINTNNASSSLTFSNNLVYVIGGDGYSGFSNSSPVGMYFDGTTGGVNIYYNSIYLSGSLTYNTATKTAGILFNTATITSIDLRNNIFMNSMNNTVNSGAKNYAIYSLTTAGNFNQINYNDYFVTGAQGVLGYIGGSDVTVLSTWQLMTGKDGASINADPQFVSTTDLRPGLGSTVVAGGTPIAGITTDYLGTVRSVTVPSIGAYEAGVDVSGPVINYTALGNTTSFTNRTLTVTITDISGVPTSGIGLPVLYWKINAGSWSAATSVSLGGNLYQFTFGTGVVVGDVVSYYVAAQDNDSPVNLVSCYPSTGAAGFSINPPAAATPPSSPSTYTIVSAICGTFNVGVAQTYTTLTAAVADLNSKMISCPVTFILTDVTYPSETFPIIINANSGSSVINTVTIKPNAGITATIAGVSGTTLLKLYGADYLTIDGLNTGGSSLTFNNSSASGVDIWISSTPTDGATYNTIKNCSLLGFNGTSTVGGILAGSGATLGNSAEAANSNNTIQNNTFKSTQNGIYINGIGAASYDQNWVVSNNTFGSAITAEKHGYRGLFIGNASNFTISNNTIVGVQSSASSSSTMTGIQVGLSINGGTISFNNIGNISQINTVGWGAAGIYLGASTTTSGLNIFNNLIYDVTGYGYSGYASTDNGYGIMIDAGGGYNLYFNTVNMYTSQTSASGIPAAINISSGISTASSVTLKNNIFNIPSSNTFGNRYAFFCAATNAVFADINYNDYYSSGTLGYLGVDLTTMPALRTATGKDVNSISTDPLFISGTDLHPQQPLLIAGVTIPGITTDYSGITRGTPPSIGAFELPQVTTVAASSITQTGASLNGTVNGCSQNVATSFEYGTTVAYGNTATASPSPATGTSITPISVALTGLTVNTLYHYRAVGKVGSATYNGADMTFDLIPTPSLSGPTPICQGSTGNVYVTESGKLNYVWSVSGGGSITAGGTPTISSVTVTWNSSGAQSVSVNYQNSIGVSAPSATVYNVTVDPTSVGGSIAGGTTVCTSTNSTTLTLSGHTGSINKWQYSTDNWSTSTDVANTTTTLTATNLIVTTKYRAAVQSGTCAFTWSNDAIITVDPVSVGGSIAGSATVCTGTNSTLLTLSGYTGSITKWQKSTDNWVTPIDIGNTTNTYTANNLTTTTKYRAVITSGVCSSANSADATVTVDPVSVGGSIAGSATVCSGTNSTLLTLSGYTGSIVKWQKSTDNWVTPVDIVNTLATYTATNLTSTTKYRAVITSGVCSSANSTDATVTVDPISVGGSIAGSATVCTGTNSTLLTLSGYTGSIVKWQKSTDNWVTPVDIVNTVSTYTATNLAATTKYRAVIQSGVCSSTNSADATVTVDPVSVGGSIAGATTVCTGTNSTLLTLSGYTGSIVKWQKSTDNWVTPVDIGNTTSTYTATNLISTTKYRAVIQSGVCFSTNSADATVTVDPVSVGGSIAGSAAVCSGTNSTLLTLSGYTGTIMKWQKSIDNWVTPVDIVNTVTTYTATNLTTTTKYRAVVQNGVCSTANSSDATVTVNTLPVPTISGPATPVSGTSGNIYTTEAGMTGYAWTITAGGTIDLGQGTNTISVTWNGTGAQSVSVTYTNGNLCSAATPTVYPVIVTAIPGPAGPITGTATVCQNQNGVAYSVAPIVNATGYAWSLPTGAIIATGNNTNSITVNYSTIASSGNITVYGTNSLGNGTVSPAYAVTVNTMPTPTITGSASVCVTSTNKVYTTQASMTSYIWSISIGGTITAGGTATSNTVTVTWNTVGAQTVSVNYTNANGCTAASPTVYNVTVNPLPVPTIIGSTSVCIASTGNVYTTQAGMTNYIWSVSAGGTIAAGGGTGNNTVTITWNTAGAQTVSVNFTNGNGCTAAAPVVSNITVNPLPVPTIAGPTPVCVTSTGNVYTTQAGMSGYIWTISAGGTTTAGSGTNAITVTWNTAGAQTVSVSYTNSNGCIAAAPVVYNVTVTPSVGTPSAITISTGTEPTCQLTNGTTTTTYATTATNNTGFNWSLSNGAAGVIGATTGLMTWANGFSGTVNIQVTANGCNGPSAQVIRTVIITPTVGTPTAITISAGTEPACQLTNGTTTTTYATTSTSNTGFNWSLSNALAGSIGATTGLMTWANGFSGTINIQVTANGCNGPSAQVIRTVTVTPTVGLPVFSLGVTSTRCQGPGTVTYTATATNSTGITYTLDAASLIAGNSIVAATGAVTYVAGWVGVSLITATATGCNGPSTASHLATTNPRPGPTITGPASVCIGSTGNVYTTQAGMSGYTWTVSAGGYITAGAGTNAITVTWNTAGAQTISINYTNSFGCPPLAPTVFNVTVNALPVPTITGPTPICMGSAGNVYTTQAGMTGYTWTVSAGGTITGGAGTNAITVTWNTAGAKTVSVIYTNANGCTAAAPTVFNVTVNTLPVPTISGQSNMCINSGNYNYTTESGMTNYVWSVSAGGVINFGSGTNQIQVSWIVAGAQTVSVTYSNGIGCSAATPTVFNVTVNPLPNQAGTITGTASVCAGANSVAYTVASIPNATTYIWTLPPYATIASGMGTNSITVNYGTNALSGNIFVNGNNLCGNGTSSPPFAVTVTPLPAIAGNITGPASVCQGTSGAVYSVGPITNATGYNWTVPAGATIVGGSNTHSITVDFSLAAVSGNITVLGTNSCGNGTVSPDFPVAVNAIPPAPVISALGDVLTSNASTGNQWYFEGTAIAAATGQTWTAQQSGWYWDVVTIIGCSSDTSNHIYILKVGIEQPPTASNVVLYPNPNEGVFTLMFTSPKQENYDIRVYNHLGVQIFEMKNLYVMGTTRQNIDLRPAPNGVYSMVITNDLSSVVKKIVINK